VSHFAPQVELTRFAQVELHCGVGPQLLPGHWDVTRLLQLALQNAPQAAAAGTYWEPGGQCAKSATVHLLATHVLPASPVRLWHLELPFTGSPATQSGPQHPG
jgi:hypothetical protein